jgi:lipoprotein signal peptidase
MYNCEGFPLVFKYVVFVVLLVLVARNLRGRFNFVIFGLILLAGALNVYEKLTTGCVYDPFDFFGLFSFNWRDAVVTAGTVVLIYENYIRR